MTNRVCATLGIEKPIIQGAMAWLTDAKLVAAVGEAGGLGILGPNAGQTTKTVSVDKTIKRMRQEVRKVKKLTARPFGVNLIPVDPAKDQFTMPMIKMMAEEQVPAAAYVGDPYPEYFKALKDAGIKIIFRQLTPTVKDAQTAEKLGADVVVATGFDEGGTMPTRSLGMFSIVPLIADAVSVPVMAAGAITDARTAKAAIDLGAEGVYCGSIFVVAKECRTDERIKQYILRSTGEDLEFLNIPQVPIFYRTLPGKYVDQFLAAVKAGTPLQKLAGNISLAGVQKGMLQGDLDHGYITIGTGIGNLKQEMPVAEIMDILMKGIQA